jgi:hypothetical protein
LSEDFDIEKVLEKEGFLLRNIRRAISEKIVAYLHFFETLINPSSPPMFVFSFLKNLNEKDKQGIKDCYKKIKQVPD